MKKHLLLFALLVLSFVAFTPVMAAGKTSNTTSAKVALLNPTQIPIVGSFTNGTFAGVFDILRFTQRGNQIFAIGNLTGTLTDAVGNTVGTVVGTVFELPVTQLIPSCDILQVVLGATDINVNSGVAVHTEQASADISAEADGSGLLGNVLCTITNLLGGIAPTFLIIILLNQVLSILG